MLWGAPTNRELAFDASDVQAITAMNDVITLRSALCR